MRFDNFRMTWKTFLRRLWWIRCPSMPGGIFWTKRVLPSAVHLLISLCQLCGFDILSPLLAFVIFNWHGHPEIKSSIFLKRNPRTKASQNLSFRQHKKGEMSFLSFSPGNLIIFSLELGPQPHLPRWHKERNETEIPFKRRAKPALLSGKLIKLYGLNGNPAWLSVSSARQAAKHIASCTQTCIYTSYTHIYKCIYICIKSIRQIRRAHFTRCRTVSFPFLPVPFSSFSAFSFCCECDFNFSIQFTFATATQTHRPLPQYPVLTPTQIRMRMRMGEQTQSASKSCKKRRQKEIAS